jgi:hypothetical protein
VSCEGLIESWWEADERREQGSARIRVGGRQWGAVLDGNRPNEPVRRGEARIERVYHAGVQVEDVGASGRQEMRSFGGDEDLRVSRCDPCHLTATHSQPTGTIPTRNRGRIRLEHPLQTTKIPRIPSPTLYPPHSPRSRRGNRWRTRWRWIPTTQARNDGRIDIDSQFFEYKWDEYDEFDGGSSCEYCGGE